RARPLASPPRRASEIRARPTSNAREPIAASDDGTSVTAPWPRTMMLGATAPSGPLDSGQLRVQPGGSCSTRPERIVRDQGDQFGPSPERRKLGSARG